MTAKVSKKNSFSTLSYQVLWLGSGIRPPRTIPLGPNVLSIDHTYAYKEGMGVGSMLVSAVNDYAVSKGLKVLPVCSFAVVWYQRHLQFQDILDRKD